MVFTEIRFGMDTRGTKVNMNICPSRYEWVGRLKYIPRSSAISIIAKAIFFIFWLRILNLGRVGKVLLRSLVIRLDAIQ